MDEKKLKSLQAFLTLHGSSWEALPKARATQFSKVYDAIERRKQAIQEAKISISENSISILSISNETGISRKTFYNNELLKAFVEDQLSEFEDSSKASSKEISDYKEQISRLEEQIRMLMLRDIDSLKQDHRIAELSRMLIEREQRISNLEKEYESVLQELNVARSQQPVRNATVVPFSPKKDGGSK